MTSLDLASVILEEVALDGLDGCTLQTFWFHLVKRDANLKLDDRSKSYLWDNAITHLGDLEFYELEEDRPHRIERECKVTDSGLEIYQPSHLLTAFPYHLVNQDGILGSCSTFDTRRCITDQIRGPNNVTLISYSETISRWADKLVMVASQTTRERFLFLDSYDPHLLRCRMTPELYLALEFLAKTRSSGLHGSDAFAHMSQSGKTTINHGLMGYIRTQFLKFNLIVKTNNMMMKDVNGKMKRITETICYLRRFYKPKPSGGDILHNTLERHLLAQPGRRDDIGHICNLVNIQRKRLRRILAGLKDYFGLSYTELSSNEICNTQTAEIVARRDVPEEQSDEEAPCTVMNTDGGGKGGCKTVLTVTLKQTRAEFEEAEAAADMNDDEEVTDGMEICEESVRQLQTSHIPLLKQIEEWVESFGPHGATRFMLGNAFGLHTLQVRQIMKQLEKQKSFHFFFVDCKRQKIGRFCSRKYADHHDAIKAKALGRTVPPPSSQSFSGSTVKLESSPAVVRDSPANALIGSKNVTEKTLERMQAVIKTAQTQQVVLFNDLYKVIVSHEESKYDTVLDRKSLKRLLEKLQKSGDISIYKTTVVVEEKSRDLFYVCDKNITLDDCILQGNIEQQKSELTSILNSSRCKAKVKQDPEKEVDERDLAQSENKLMEYELSDATTLRAYGYAGKMKRCEVLHKFLLYVTYNYEGKSDLAVKTDNKTNTSADSCTVDSPTVYHDSNTWKRFIPPSILVDKNIEGVVHLTDLGAHLPLSIFLKVVKVQFKVPAIMELLEDPVKQHIPVKYLPNYIQTALYHKRRYRNVLKDVASLLCMMGLCTYITSAGEGQYLFKQYMTVYLHRVGIVTDTRDGTAVCELSEEECRKRRHVIPLDKDGFHVDEFWLSVKSICINSGAWKTSCPKRPDMFRKPALKRAIELQSLEDVKEGIVPGDGRGACGLDELFFSHLPRHWTSSGERILPSKMLLPKNRLISNLSVAEKRRLLLDESQRIVRPSYVSVSHSTRQLPTRTVRTGVTKETAMFRGLGKHPLMESQADEDTCTVKKKKKGDSRRDEDDVDRIAASKLKTLRASFSPQEDDILICCQIGLDILGCKEVASKPIRDYLHKMLPSISLDKSSTACWARLRRLVKWDQKARTIKLYRSISLNHSEIASFQDKEPLLSSQTFNATFFKLMDSILSVCGNFSSSEVTIDLSSISSFDELKQYYSIIYIEEDSEQPRVLSGHRRTHAVAPPVQVTWVEPENRSAVAIYTLANFIMSYLLVNDKISRTYQMHKVLEQYPQKVTEEALNLLRHHKNLTLKTGMQKHTMKKFALTHRYQLFTERIQRIFHKNFLECGVSVRKLTDMEEPFDCSGLTEATGMKGYLLALVSLFDADCIDISFSLPETVLDTSNIQPSEDEEDFDENSPNIEDQYENRSKFEDCQLSPCSVRAKIRKDKFHDLLMSSRNTDRQIVKSIMSTVPFSLNVENEFCHLEKEFSSNDFSCMKRIYCSVDESGHIGKSLESLQTEMTDFSQGELLKMPQHLETLVKSCLILPVGLMKRHFVSYPNCRMWCVHSLRDTKGRGSGIQLTEQDRITLAEAYPAEEHSERTKSNSETQSEDAVSRIRTTFHRVDIIPKPWLTPEGTINYPILHEILASIVSLLNYHHSCRLDEIQQQLSQVYSPAAVIDLLDILIGLGALDLFYVTRHLSQSCLLFSKRTQVIISDLPSSNLSVPHYKLRPDGFIRVSDFIKNTTYSH